MAREFTYFLRVFSKQVEPLGFGVWDFHVVWYPSLTRPIFYEGELKDSRVG